MLADARILLRATAAQFNQALALWQAFGVCVVYALFTVKIAVEDEEAVAVKKKTLIIPTGKCKTALLMCAHYTKEVCQIYKVKEASQEKNRAIANSKP